MAAASKHHSYQVVYARKRQKIKLLTRRFADVTIALQKGHQNPFVSFSPLIGQIDVYYGKQQEIATCQR
jgi:hypothetical protein